MSREESEKVRNEASKTSPRTAIKTTAKINDNSELITAAIGSFHGGIHPPQYKSISNQRPIDTLPIAAALTLPLRQHIGQPSIPKVTVGDKVLYGQLIAECPTSRRPIAESPNSAIENTIGARLHSPCDGVIISIEARDIGHPSGLKQNCIVIKPNPQQVSAADTNPETSKKEPTEIPSNTSFVDGGFEDKGRLNPALQNSNIAWQNCAPKTLLKQVADAGIVGLGGATFPTQIKLTAQPIDTLIVNAMECEPYITCDDRLLQQQAAQVIEGAQIAAFIVRAKSIVFAIEDNKPQAIDALKKAIVQITATSSNELDDSANQNAYHNLQAHSSMRIVVAPTKYPSGGEKQTIELVTGRQLPHGQLPSSIGLLAQNVATLYSIYLAIVHDRPLTHRLVTITGDRVKRAGNYWLPLGTPLSHIQQLLEINNKSTSESANESATNVVIGGPLMGQSSKTLATPVTKSTNCLIFNGTGEINAEKISPVKSSAETKNKEPAVKNWVIEPVAHQACIRCGDCEKICPASLLPQQLYWFSQSEQWQPSKEQGLLDCIECGACAYVCPSEIPLVHYFRFAKSQLTSNKSKQLNAEKAKQRFEFREMRLARARQERALKHQIAAEQRRLAAENKPDDPSGKQTAINQALERVKQKKALKARQANQSAKANPKTDQEN